MISSQVCMQLTYPLWDLVTLWYEFLQCVLKDVHISHLSSTPFEVLDITMWWRIKQCPDL